MAAHASEFEIFDFDRLLNLMLTVGKEEEFNAELKEKPSLVKIKNECHMTLLHMAARNGNIEIWEILIENGADPFFLGGVRRNQTALHFAAQNSYFFAVFLTQLTKKWGKDLTPLLEQVLQQITYEIFKSTLMPILKQSKELKATLSLLNELLQQIEKLEETFQLLMCVLQKNLLQEILPTLAHILMQSNPGSFSPSFQKVLTHVQTNLSGINTTSELMAILKCANAPRDFTLLLEQLLDTVTVNLKSSTFITPHILHLSSPIFNYRKPDSDEPERGVADSDEALLDTDRLRPRRWSYS